MALERVDHVAEDEPQVAEQGVAAVGVAASRAVQSPTASTRSGSRAIAGASPGVSMMRISASTPAGRAVPRQVVHAMVVRQERLGHAVGEVLGPRDELAVVRHETEPGVDDPDRAAMEIHGQSWSLA